MTYEVATSLLGYTPDNLLDEVIDAFAAVDGAGVFGVVDKVIETGQDPRRFTEDVLRRLRDLVIVAAVPDAPASGLIDAPQDQAERLVAQAARFGRSELVRAADLVASGLTEMRGATTPRLLLELICARLLLPAIDHDSLGLGARLDRLERRVAVSGSVGGGDGGGSPSVAGARPARAASVQSRPTPPATEPGQPVAPPAAAPTDEQRAERVVSRDPEPTAPPADPPSPSPSAEAEPSGQVGGAVLSLADVRRIWPDLLEAVKKMRRFTWILLSQNAQVIGVDATSLTVGFKTAGARDSFVGGGSEEILRQAAIDMIGADWKIEVAIDPSAQPGAETAPRVVRPAVPPTSPPPPSTQASPADPSAAPSPPSASGPPSWASDDDDAGDDDGDVAGDEQPAGAPARGRTTAAAAATARSNIAPTRRSDEPAPVQGTPLDDDAHRDDPAAEDNALDSTELLQRELGATVIEEIPHD